MGKHDKLFERFMKHPPLKDLTFKELETLLSALGFVMIQGSGSRVKFVHADKNLVISLHKPHPSNLLKTYIVKEIQQLLKGWYDGNA